MQLKENNIFIKMKGSGGWWYKYSRPILLSGPITVFIFLSSNFLFSHSCIMQTYTAIFNQPFSPKIGCNFSEFCRFSLWINPCLHVNTYFRISWCTCSAAGSLRRACVEQTGLYLAVTFPVAVRSEIVWGKAKLFSNNICLSEMSDLFYHAA